MNEFSKQKIELNKYGFYWIEFREFIHKLLVQ